MGEDSAKEALKELRTKRKDSIDRAKKAIKRQSKIIKDIKEQIKTTGKTIPEIAENINLPPSQVLLYIATLRKYGMVAEREKDGDYFKYQMEG